MNKGGANGMFGTEKKDGVVALSGKLTAQRKRQDGNLGLGRRHGANYFRRAKGGGGGTEGVLAEK